jgi:hypothetical protein
MAERAYTTLVTRLSPHLASCPHPVIVDQIRLSAIQACERTLIYRHVQTEFNLTPNQFTYTYTKPANTDVHAVFEAIMNDKPLERLTLEQALERNPRWADVSQTDEASEPRIICDVTTESYNVFPMPDASKTYKLRLVYALKPTRASTGLEQWVFDELEDCIFHNALQELMLMPNQPWSNADVAGYHAKQYVFKLSERRARANLGTMRGSMSVRMKPFA